MSLMELNGFHPEKWSTRQFEINPGSCADSTGTDMIVNPSSFLLDLNAVGLNGRDVGFALGSYTQLYLYVVKNPTTGAVGCVASRGIFYSDVTLPPGFTVVRKLPFGIPYNDFWDGIADYHCACWPRPLITFTRSEFSTAWLALVNGQSGGEWAYCDVSGWVPDNARQALLRFETRQAGGAGSAYAKPADITGGGHLVGSTPISNCPQPIRVSSDRRIQWKTTGGAALFIQVLGYYMTEPS